MAKMAGFGEWASDLMRALGEDPGMTRGVTLRVYPDEPVVAYIEKYVDSDNGRLIKTIKKVAWVEEPQEEVNNANS